MPTQSTETVPVQAPAPQTEGPTTGSGGSGGAQSTLGNAAVQGRMGGSGGAEGGDGRAARDPTAAATACASAADFGAIVNDAAAVDVDVLAAMAALQRNNTGAVATVVADATMMTAALSKLGPNHAALGLLHFQFGNAQGGDRMLRNAVKWLKDTVGLTGLGWGRLAAGRDAHQFVQVIAMQEAFDAVKELPGDPLVLMPGLSMDPPALRTAVADYPQFIEWVRARGGPERVQQVMDHIGGQTAADAIRAALSVLGLWDGFLAGLASGPASDPDAKRMLYYFLMNSPDDARNEWNTLFQKRFAIELNFGPADASLTRDSAGTLLENPSQTPWDKPSVVRSWQILDLSPAADVAASQRIIREGNTGDAGGWAGMNSDTYDMDNNGSNESNGARNGQREIGMTWSTGSMGNTEIGAYTDDSDPMRGLNIFDSTFRHELGHNVADKQGYDKEGGFVFTQFGWDEHKGDDLKSTLTDVVLPVHGLPLTTQPAAQRAGLRTRVIEAIAGVNRHNVANYRTVVDNVQAGLWAIVAGEPFGQFLISRLPEGSWNAMSAIGDRTYHVSYDWAGWVSVPTARYTTKPSTYAMRSPWEWFAECYATFYAEADMTGQAPGGLLAARDAEAAEAFRSIVHARHNLAVETGQGSVGVAASAPDMRGDFPTPRNDGTALA